MKRFREAREIYLLLLASTQNLDSETLAATHHAIGYSSIELLEFDDAEANLLRAISLYRQAGQPANVLKVELGRGRLLFRRGQPIAAITHLRPIRRELLRNGLSEEAGICGLEIIEALLALARLSEAETLTRKIVREFTLANLSTRAIAALGYLAEAAAARAAPPQLATEVREYIVSLRHQPEREFVTKTAN